MAEMQRLRARGVVGGGPWRSCSCSRSRRWRWRGICRRSVGLRRRRPPFVWMISVCRGPPIHRVAFRCRECRKYAPQCIKNVLAVCSAPAYM
jgi:hypothetical protein